MLNFNFRQSSTTVSDDGKYLLVYVDASGDGNLVYYVDLEKNGKISNALSLTPIITEFKSDYAVGESIR